jgi:glyoxylase-like metal-dependent hydrolase (beta-lactamase superfamily II)
MSLEYPIAAPQPGQFVQVQPDLFWIRLPLPFALDHINVWGLLDDHGWTLVDTGIRTDATLAVWAELLQHSPFDKPLRRVIATHMHPDHLGLAGWLCRKFDAPLYTSRLEYLSCRALITDTGREAPAAALRFLHQAGWSEAALEKYKGRFGSFGKFIHPLPDSYERLNDGSRLTIAGSQWQVLIGAGHSPEHVCLYCPERDVLISGDQVLPKISSNVSVHPMEPAANPMQDWLESLDKLQAALPATTLVLPAHHDAFTGLHERLNHLRSSQLASLNRLRDTLHTERRVVDVFEALFGRPISEQSPNYHLATGESMACLNYLLARTQAKVRIAPEDGVARWSAV